MFLRTIPDWASEPVELPAEIVDAVAASGLVRVERDPPAGWLLTADSRIGIVMGTGWEIRVAPRLKVPKLMFLLGYACDPAGWRTFTAPMTAEDDLFSAVASGFATQARRALEAGVLRGYRAIEESSQVVRGRLRIADQIARQSGLPIPVEIEYDEHTIDITENRLLASAFALLLRFPRVPDLARAQLRRVLATLAEVGPPAEPRSPPITRLNARYAPALRLAELILTGMSVGTHRGEVSSAAFVFDMNQVFEDFLGAALTDALRVYGGRTQLQQTGFHLDRERRLPLRPDITWWHGGSVAAVLDAKYKPLHDKQFPNADAYQMLAYCKAFGLNEGTLVYARGEALERLHHLPDRVRLRVAALDVELEPAKLLAQVEALAALIANSRAARDDLPRDPAGR